MALDPNILFRVQPRNTLGTIVQGVQSGLQAKNVFDQIQQREEEAPIRNQILQQQQQAGAQLAAQNQQAELLKQQNRELASVASTWSGVQSLVDAGDFEKAAKALEANKAVLGKSGITNFDDTDVAIAALRSGDPAQINDIKRQGSEAIRIATERGLFDKKGESAEQKTFENLIKNFTPEEKAQARRVKAGLNARAVGSASSTVATSGLTDVVATSLETIEEGKAKGRATGKAKGELESAPIIAKAQSDIAAAVVIAKQEATARGETLGDLASAQAALPGLRGVVDQLRELAPIATSTLSGRVFDIGVKELGFGSTEGATAKAKFIALINNQVLPLLKPTFGGAFTVQEGDALKATLGDPNATPEEKMAQLDAFIDGKIREIQTKERRLDQPVTPAETLRGDTGITAEQFTQMTPAQRAEVINNLRGQ